MKTQEYVLSIAGLDPCGGAGILSDAKTFAAFGLPYFCVATALTFQNESEFRGVRWVTQADIIRQLGPLFDKYSICAVKIGLVESLDILEQLLQFLYTKRDSLTVVWDPIIRASAGFTFHEHIDAQQVQHIVNQVDCITPNELEARVLCGLEYSSAQDAARQLSYQGATLLTGIQAGGKVKDSLYGKGKQQREYFRQKLPSGERHGSGCVFSSSLTAQLSLGKDLIEAAEQAGQFCYQFLQTGSGLLGNQYEVEAA